MTIDALTERKKDGFWVRYYGEREVIKLLLNQKTHSAWSILIVEDDKGASEVVGRIIAKRYPDASVFVAGDGKLGIKLFKKHLPDVVLTDINMPEMNGI